MRLTLAMADWLVDRVAQRLNSGTITIRQVDTLPLVSFDFQADAFQPAVQAVALANTLQPSVVSATGRAAFADLATSTGEVIAEVSVRSAEDPDAEEGDVIVDRTDFHRGGVCVLERVTLTVPLRP